MDKQMDLGTLDLQAASSDNDLKWQSLNDLELACVGGGIGDTILA
jgi:hypothetical protein